MPTLLPSRPQRRRGSARFRKTRLSANRPENKRRSRLPAKRHVVLLGPFGEPLIPPTGLAAEMPFRFSTKYNDAETRLLYYGYRYYDPITGRWLNRDPIGEKGGFNIYGFVDNRPVGRSDRLGLAQRSDIGAGTLTYTCNCGWVDWGHAKPDNAKSLWDNISQEIGREAVSQIGRADNRRFGFYVYFREEMARRFPLYGMLRMGVDGEYWVKNSLSLQQKESAALGIFKEVSESFEAFQSEFPSKRVKDSGFSEEDLVSNLIGFYIAVRGYTVPQAQQWCSPVPVSVSYKIWDQNGGLKKSKKWEPNYYDADCCYLQAQPHKWPSQFTGIKEAEKGTIWRNWSVEKDDVGYSNTDDFIEHTFPK